MRKLTRDNEEPNVQTTVSESLVNLGLDKAFLISAMEAFGHKSALSRNSRLRLSKISVTDWLWLCEFLYMPLDLAYGNWLRVYQCTLVGAAILEGRFILPMTTEVRSLLREFIQKERHNIRFNKTIYGSPLLERIIAERRVRARERRLVKLKNQATKRKLEDRHGVLRALSREIMLRA